MTDTERRIEQLVEESAATRARIEAAGAAAGIPLKRQADFLARSVEADALVAGLEARRPALLLRADEPEAQQELAALPAQITQHAQRAANFRDAARLLDADVAAAQTAQQRETRVLAQLDFEIARLRHVHTSEEFDAALTGAVTSQLHGWLASADALAATYHEHFGQPLGWPDPRMQLARVLSVWLRQVSPQTFSGITNRRWPTDRAALVDDAAQIADPSTISTPASDSNPAATALGAPGAGDIFGHQRRQE